MGTGRGSFWSCGGKRSGALRNCGGNREGFIAELWWEHIWVEGVGDGD